MQTEKKIINSFDEAASCSNSEFMGSKPRTVINIGIIKEDENEQNITLKDIMKVQKDLSEEEEKQDMVEEQFGEESPIKKENTMISPVSPEFAHLTFDTPIDEEGFGSLDHYKINCHVWDDFQEPAPGAYDVYACSFTRRKNIPVEFQLNMT